MKKSNQMNALSDRLRLWGFEQDIMIFDDGSLGFGLKLNPIDQACFSDDAANGAHSNIAQFLNGLPPLIDIQFVADIGSGNGAVISEHERLAEDANSDAARALTTSRANRLRESDRQGHLPIHDLYCFVRRPMSQALLGRPKLFAKAARYPAISEERLSRELTLISQLKEQVKQGLSSIGISHAELSTREVIKLVYSQWNPGRARSDVTSTATSDAPSADNSSRDEIEDYDPQDVRSSLLYTDVGILDRGFLIGDTQHRVVSLKNLPDQTSSCMGAHFRELPFGSRLFVTIHIPDQTKEIESLQTNRRIAFAMARGKRSGVSDIDSEAKFQDLETLLEQMIAQGEKVFRVSVNVLLSSTDQSLLEERVAQTLSCFRGLSGAEGMEETLASFLVFSEFALPNARANERAKRMKTSNVADLLPLFGPWEGMNHPSILLRTRAGSLFKFDPFDAELTNANQLVSGGSGSGKSFMTNILLLQMLKENPKVFFVDIGGSYKKLCENLSGQYLPLGVGAGISINPFDLLPGEAVVSGAKIKFLLGLVELMTKEDDESRLPKLERSEIEEAIRSLYDRIEKPRLSDLQKVLLSHPDTAIKRYGRILSSWCGQTPFGQFVDQPTNIELNRSIVAFDLKGMEAYPELQAVSLFLITDLVWREVQRERLTQKFLVFDECWKLLKSDSGLVFIEEVFRTFRKYRASAIAISQDIDDFAKSKIASAILPNCSIKWLLMQPQTDGARISEVLNLNPNEVSLVQSLSQEKGKYSEAFLIAQKNRTVAVIDSSPLEYWIATTDPRDLSAVDAHVKERPECSHLERLQDLSSRFPEGVAAFLRTSSGGSK